VLDWDPHLIKRIEGDPTGANGPLEYAGKCQIKGEAAITQQQAGPTGLLYACGGEIHIDPTRKSIFKVPLALTVTKDDQRSGV
jgi:hypothetical protein